MNVAFGIIIDDLVFPDGRTQMGVLGGGGPQTAWGMAAALGSGEQVGLVAGVGDDLSAEMLAPLTEAGINLDGLRVTRHPTPRAWQIHEADGRRTQVWRTPPRFLGEQLAKNHDMVPYPDAQNFHWGLHPGDGDLRFANELRGDGKRVSLEAFKPADAPLNDDERRALFTACDVFAAGCDEFASLFDDVSYDDALAAARDAGLPMLVIRKGAEGVSVYDFPNGRAYHADALPANVVDVTGAGNAFSGAFVARLDDGIAQATCHGLAAAAYMIEQVGIPRGLPDDYAERLNAARANLQESSF